MRLMNRYWESLYLPSYSIQQETAEFMVASIVIFQPIPHKEIWFGSKVMVDGIDHISTTVIVILSILTTTWKSLYVRLEYSKAWANPPIKQKRVCVISAITLGISKANFCFLDIHNNGDLMIFPFNLIKWYLSAVLDMKTKAHCFSSILEQRSHKMSRKVMCWVSFLLLVVTDESGIKDA